MAEIPEQLRLENQLCFPIHVAANLVARSYRPLLEPLGLTYPQYLVMLVLWERHTVTVGELASTLYLDSGTLTPMLKRMAAAGLLVRSRNAGDERRVDIIITDKGKALLQTAKDVPQTMLCKLDAPVAWLNGIREDMNQLLAKLQTPPK